MSLNEAVDRACAEPTYLRALSWMADWECDRAIRQALRQKETGISTAAHGLWDTCFDHCFRAVALRWVAQGKHQDMIRVGDYVTDNLDHWPEGGLVLAVTRQWIIIDGEITRRPEDVWKVE